MDEFMQDAYLSMLTYGMPELFVDMAPIEGEVVSQKQIIDSNMLPYVRIMPPTKRTNWGVSKFGEYYWVVFKDTATDDTEPANQTEKDAVYLLLQPHGWELWERSTEIKDSGFTKTNEGPYLFGRIPLVPFFKQWSKKYKRFGVSAIQETAPSAKAILNLISQQQQDIFTSFAFLVFQSDSAIEAPSEMGTSTIMTYPTEAKNKPEFLTVPVDHIRVKQEVIDTKVEHMIRSAKLSSSIGELSHKVSRSGIAGEVERRELYTVLQELARNCEQAEMGVISYVVSWLKGDYVPPEETGFEVHYNDTFRLEATPELIELADKVSNIYKITSPTFVKETLKKLPQTMLREGSDTLETVIEEIDNSDPAEMDLIPLDNPEE
jgi:hypothetical protein